MTAMIELLVIGDDAQVQRKLSALEQALEPKAIAGFLLYVTSDYLQHRAEDRFASEGDSAVGGPWLPLLEITKQIRISQQFAPGPINHRTGELEQFITKNKPDVHINPGGATLTMPGKPLRGLLRKKFKTAQQGDPDSNTPARPVLALDSIDLSVTLSDLETYIMAAMV